MKAFLRVAVALLIFCGGSRAFADLSSCKALFQNPLRCTLCRSDVPKFLDHGVPPRPGQCPQCGAKGRHRDVFHLIEVLQQDGTPREVLEVGPSKVTTTYLPQHLLPGSRYTAIDIYHIVHQDQIRLPHRFLLMDGTKMEFAAESFDLILANSVLSFVADADKMIAEISRVLRPGGVAVLNVHRTDEPTMTAEQYRLRHPELTPDYIEMNGSAWFFGDDYLALLKRHGFAAVVLNYNAKLAKSRLSQEGRKAYAEMILAAHEPRPLQQILARIQYRAELVEAAY